MNKQRSLIDSFNNAIEGIIYVLRTQKNMQRHFLAAFFVLIFSIFLKVDRLEFLVLLFSITLVMVAELVNTAMESAIDITTTTFDPLAKIAKDVSAAAVLISAINAVVVGVVIFYLRVSNWTVLGITKIKALNMYITLSGLFLVLLLVVIIKTFKGQHSFFKGGWISGHSAVAFFGWATIVFLTNGNAVVALVGLLMALLVGQTRIEAKIHRPSEVLVGAIVGFLVAVFVFQVIGKFKV